MAPFFVIVNLPSQCRDLLHALRARGFQLNDGIHGTGFGLLAWSKAGGYYLGTPLSFAFIYSYCLHCVPCTDTGGSQLIADGKIKLKSGPQIERFTEHAILFDDGSELQADVVVFATGCTFTLPSPHDHNLIL
jgi:hypothetical protein